MDMVLTLDGQMQIIEPKHDRDLALPKAGKSDAVVRPLTVNAGS